jgi:hypothetical protein
MFGAHRTPVKGCRKEIEAGMSREIGPILSEIEGRIQTAASDLEDLVQELLRSMPEGEGLLEWIRSIKPEDKTTLGRIETSARSYNKAYQRFLDLYGTVSINAELLRAFDGLYDENDYTAKKSYVLQVNEQLRQINSAISHPKTGEPCLLLAVNSRDGAGRYTLQSRLTKKRLGSYKSLSELLPIHLVKDVPRKEGVIERRKNTDKAPD